MLFVDFLFAKNYNKYKEENYLQKALELHVDNLVRLRTLYLE